MHDEVNLRRLVPLLEQAVEDWGQSNSEPNLANWAKAASKLEEVKHARKLLASVQLYDTDPSHDPKYEIIRVKIDNIEQFFSKLEQSTKPPSVRPLPLLPTILVPTPLPPELVMPEDPEALPVTTTDNLLLSPGDITPLPSTTFPRPEVRKEFSQAQATGSSSALQEELSNQLSQMATQLKRNALHFSNSLANDAALVNTLDEKLERNYDVMKKERVRLRDHRGKSLGTTCLVMSSVVGVVAVFIVMVGIMRVT